LDNIKDVFNEGSLLRFTRKWSVEKGNPFDYIPTFSMLTIMAVALSQSFMPEFNEYAREYVGIIIGTGLVQIGIAEVLNTRYAKKLSDQAGEYFYGRNAEERLEKELNFNVIQSGKITKENYLMPTNSFSNNMIEDKKPKNI